MEIAARDAGAIAIDRNHLEPGLGVFGNGVTNECRTDGQHDIGGADGDFHRPVGGAPTRFVDRNPHHRLQRQGGIGQFADLTRNLGHALRVGLRHVEGDENVFKRILHPAEGITLVSGEGGRVFGDARFRIARQA